MHSTLIRPATPEAGCRIEGSQIRRGVLLNDATHKGVIETEFAYVHAVTCNASLSTDSTFRSALYVALLIVYD